MACGFHGPDGAFVTAADLRAGIVSAALAERAIWWVSTSSTVQKEDNGKRFGDLVRYWLAGQTGTIPPNTLGAALTAALDPLTTYDNLGSVALEAVRKKFGLAEARVNALTRAVYGKSLDLQVATALLKRATTELGVAAATMKSAEARVKAARSQSGAAAKAALEKEQTALGLATTAFKAAQKVQRDAATAKGAAATALKDARKDHEKAKVSRKVISEDPRTKQDPNKAKIHSALKEAQAVLAKVLGSKSQASEALFRAHRSRADMDAWSAVFVVACVRVAAISRNLEIVDSTAGHLGINDLLEASPRHADYVVKARERERTAVRGAYHAFEPGHQAVKSGDIICTDREDFITTPVLLKDVKRGNLLHGDIVTLVKLEKGKPAYAETIGGNVKHTVRRRRYPLDASGHLIVSSDQLYAEEEDNGALAWPITPLMTPAPTMLAGANTARICALLSLVEECKPLSPKASTGSGATTGKQERFAGQLIEGLESPFLSQEILPHEPPAGFDVASLVAESPFEQFTVETLATKRTEATGTCVHP
jgi:hypothetical protein